MAAPASSTLPRDLIEVFDGSRLDGGVGKVFQLITLGSDGFPRVAALSVGEILAESATALKLLLYASSGTATGLRDSGRALLVFRDGPSVVKIRLRVTTSMTVKADGDRRHLLARCEVVDVVRDEVPYAEVVSGYEYVLLDPAPVLARWKGQLELMRETGL